MNIYTHKRKSSLPGLLFSLFLRARPTLHHLKRCKKVDYLLSPTANVFHLSKGLYNNPDHAHNNDNKCQQQRRLQVWDQERVEICDGTVSGPRNHLVWHVSIATTLHGTQHADVALVWFSAKHKLLTDYRVYCVSFLLWSTVHIMGIKKDCLTYCLLVVAWKFTR